LTITANSPIWAQFSFNLNATAIVNTTPIYTPITPASNYTLPITPINQPYIPTPVSTYINSTRIEYKNPALYASDYYSTQAMLINSYDPYDPPFMGFEIQIFNIVYFEDFQMFTPPLSVPLIFNYHAPIRATGFNLLGGSLINPISPQPIVRTITLNN
jgi:hypothetical protein